MTTETYTDSKNRKWTEYKDKDYSIETEDGDILYGTATILIKEGTCVDGTDWYFVDKEHQIESKSLAFNYKDARKYFEETINTVFGKINWEIEE
jgi:hypothetical protein